MVYGGGQMRPTKEEWAVELAKVTAERSTCLRRHVGCVLLNKRGHVLATGYNGVATGVKHCNESINFGIPNVATYPHACPGATAASGTDLDQCQAIHAEQNALLQCKDVYEIHTCVVTVSPCITCVKLLLNTGCREIVFAEPYAHDKKAQELWLAGRDFQRSIDLKRAWWHLNE